MIPKKANEANELQIFLNQLVGQKVLQTSSGDFTGSIFTIDLGESLITGERNGLEWSEGKCGFMVWCAWRLYDSMSERIITNWNERSGENQPLTLGLKSLVGRKITKIRLSQFFDLEISFDGNVVLSIFCDLVSNEEDSNWYCWIAEKQVDIGTNLKCLKKNWV